MKKISLLCGLLGLSLYTNIAYADKIYDGVIGFSCVFKTTPEFISFLQEHRTDPDLGKISLEEVKKGYYNFPFTGEYDEKASKKPEFSFIDDPRTDRVAALDSSGKPIFTTALITGLSNINPKPFQLSLSIDISSRVKSKDGVYKVNASFDYTDIKHYGEIEGVCNFKGFPYSDTESEDDEPMEPSVVIHTNEKSK